MKTPVSLVVAIGASMLAGSLTVPALAQDAVQWTIAEGGNGHWYQVVAIVNVTWDEADQAAINGGAELASVQSAAENSFLYANCASHDPAWKDGIQTSFGPWIGGVEVDDEWTWTDGSEWTYANWAAQQPSGKPDGTGRVHFHNMWTETPAPTWNDLKNDRELNGYIIEWSADCNDDGIVDYGQILDGTLVDTDQNGVPDWCDSCTGDVNGDGTVDAADLGALLALWGTNANSSPRADANRDGTVDAADLGLLLGYWGDCP